MSAKVLDMAGLVLLIAVPVLYVLRTQDQRPLRGRWLLVIVGAVAIVPAAAWYRALHLDLAWPADALAVATTVPLAQLGALVVSLSIFKWFVGRPPARFTFQAERQDNIDTLMHGFVLFVVAIGGIFLYTSFRH